MPASDGQLSATDQPHGYKCVVDVCEGESTYSISLILFSVEAILIHTAFGEFSHNTSPLTYHLPERIWRCCFLGEFDREATDGDGLEIVAI
jgi:hypothetical protein